jgi:pilus assembly protein CpaF
MAGLNRDAARSMLAAALDVVIHLDRARDGVRRMAEVGVLSRSGSEVQTAISFGHDLRGVRGPAWGRLEELIGG